MTDKEALRQTALADSEPLGTKQRFGLFSQPISIAIGDDGPYKTKLRICNIITKIPEPIKERANLSPSLDISIRDPVGRASSGNHFSVTSTL